MSTTVTPHQRSAASTGVRLGPPPAEPTEPSARDTTTPGLGPVGRWRLRRAVICAAITGLVFNSGGGLIAPDTKLDLLVNPARFLGRTLSLWDPTGSGGQLQNQAYGYLFPMGPFFLLGHAVGLPGWVIQRAWWSTLLCAAFLGFLALAGALRIGTPLSRTIAAVAYATSPHLLSIMGTSSIELLPMCVAPWAVVPLVRAGRGSVSLRRAGLLCGVAVLFMGGVNAAAVLAGTVPAALWILTRRWTRPTAVLAGWSVAGVLLATLWWVAPLLVLGRYSPPFLDYIESASVTTSTTSVVDTLRGTSDWLAYVSPDTRSGYVLLTDRVLIALSVAVVAAGLAGLAAWRGSERTWPVACLGVGLAMVTLGHLGPLDGLFAGPAHTALDGVLAPLRNLHKFDVLLRLPLALGLARLVPALRWGGNGLERRVSSRLSAAIATVLVLGTAAPLLGLTLTPTRSATTVPAYWRQAVGWLDEQPGGQRSLAVPSSRFADYDWGRLSDEPLQSLARSRWDVRSAIPLVPAGHIRMLDTIERTLATGAGSPTLAAYLDREGFGYLLVRNDLNYAGQGTLSPLVVHATLQNSPGLRRVAHFGPIMGSAGVPASSLDQGQQGRYPAVEVWAVGRSDRGPVSAVLSSTVLGVSGGPDSLPTLLAQGVAVGRPTVRARDLPSSSGAGINVRYAVTDGLRAREVDFGRPVGDPSLTMTRSSARTVAASPDYLDPGSGADLTYARFVGVRSVEASSSGADATSPAPADAAQQPFSAVDGDPGTAWRSAPGAPAVGQWLQLDFGRTIDLSSVVVTPASGGRPITGLRVSTAAGSNDVALGGSARQPVAVTPGRSTFLRLTVTGADLAPAGVTDATVGLADVRIPGVTVTRTLDVPSALPSGAPADLFSFAAATGRRAGCLREGNRLHCIAGRARGGEDVAGVDRTFAVPVAGRYDVSVMATPRGGTSLNRLLADAARPATVATASSSAVPDPVAGPQAAVDGSAATSWVAAAGDPDPTLSLRWKKPIRLSSLRLLGPDPTTATVPDAVTVRTPAGARNAFLNPDGVASFAPITTDRIELHVKSTKGLRPNVDASGTGVGLLGVGVADVRITGLPAAPLRPNRPVLLTCGSGPRLSLDGRDYPTAVSTTVRAILNGALLPVTVCGRPELALGRGTHRVVLASSPTFQAATVSLAAAARTNRSADPGPAVTAVDWEASRRRVAVGARTQPALLVVDENVNAGWRARLNGRSLPTVTVDGWKQGYRLPAGAAGTVALTFTPQLPYRLGLLAGGVSVLVLLALVALTRRDRLPSGDQRPAAALIGPIAAAGFAVAVAALVGGGGGLIVLAGVVMVAGGLARLLVVERDRAVALSALAAVAYLAAGFGLWRHPFGGLGWDPGSTGIQVAGLAAVLVVLVAPSVNAALGARRPRPPDVAGRPRPPDAGPGPGAAGP